MSTLLKAIDNSLCFGGFLGDRQVAFARVVTDYATFAYLRDVFVLPPHQGQGYGKQILSAVVSCKELQKTTIFLHTASSLFYEKFGFKPAPSTSDILMVRPRASTDLNRLMSR